MGRARFSRAPKTFRTHKATVSSSTTKNGEACTPETPFMEGPLFILRDFAIALERFETFEEQFLIPVFHSSFSLKTFDPLVAKNGDTCVKNTCFGFFIIKQTAIPGGFV